jgi:hypothetical protein
VAASATARPAAPGLSPAAAAARAAVAVAVTDAPGPAAAPEDGLAGAALAEVRMALRGCTDGDLSAALSSTPAQVAAVTERLSAAGALVRRGNRWFTA